jgi:metal-responsive CopG/Arc/MetJ family transcriptional regulator
MPARSVSVSLDEALLAQLDAEIHAENAASGLSRSRAMAEALELWIRQRRLVGLQQAYAALGQLEPAGDLDAAICDADEMGRQALAGLHD